MSSVGRMLRKVTSGIPKGQQRTGAGLRSFTGVARVCKVEAGSSSSSSTVGIRHREVVDYSEESFDTAPDDESRSHSLSGNDFVGDDLPQPSPSDPSAVGGMNEGPSRKKQRESPSKKKGEGGASYVWEKSEILGSGF